MIKGLGLKMSPEAAMEYLLEKGRITTGEYIKITGASRATAKRALLDLVEKDIIDKMGKRGKGVYYVLRL